MDQPLQGTRHKHSPKTTCQYLVKYLSYVTVEPTLVFYMMAFMITNVVEQSFFVYKACSVNHGYNDTVCNNMNAKKYADITKEVQVSFIGIQS